jgi:YesN/AraC family two-component response regulator
MDHSPHSPADPDELRALIVDDEAPARERLRSLLEEIRDVTVISEAANGVEALERCTKSTPETDP